MYEKELFDETLDINSTNNYEISIQLGLDGFSFCLLDRLRNRFVMFRNYNLGGKEQGLADEIRDIAAKDEFLSRQYRRYRIVFNFEKSTIVPAALYDPALKDEYFELNHKLKDNYIVSNNRLTRPDAYLLFDIRKDVYDLSYKLFPDATLSHQVKPLLDSSFRQTRTTKDQYIRIHIDPCFFTLVMLKDEKLQFFNTFRVRNDSDILYYLMNSFDRFKIDNDQVVYVSGNISKFDDLYNNLLRYIKTIKLANPEGEFSMSYIFDEMETHRYSNLFNIVSCA
ncbi:MAG: DUF3822 family protein [Bacteroidota bacterium]|nr:DUF3822 family protein [Bacteroidota bacterium]